MDGSAGLVSSSMEALSKRYRAVTHNLANANTVGFKKRRSMFAQALAQKQSEMSASGQSAPSVRIRETSLIDFTQGALTRTGRPLDVAISGEGMFVLETPNGNVPHLYTRNGTFSVDKDRRIVDASGRMLLSTNGPITLPGGSSPAQLLISREGKISVNGESIGSIRIVEFKNKKALVPVGRNCFAVSDDAERSTPKNSSIQQGYREASNVSVVEELVDLITVTRLYEANLRSIGKQDDRMKHILQVAMA